MEKVNVGRVTLVSSKLSKKITSIFCNIEAHPNTIYYLNILYPHNLITHPCFFTFVTSFLKAFFLLLCHPAFPESPFQSFQVGNIIPMDFRDFFFLPSFPVFREYAGSRSFIKPVTQTANPPDQSCKNGRSAIHHKSPLFFCNRAFQGKWATTFNYSSEGPRPWTQVTTYFRFGTWESQDGLSLYLL